jgi:preprotein translocase subunit SecE
VCAVLDGERLLIETRHGEEFAELSMEVFDVTRRVRWPKKLAPEPSL